MAKEVVMAAVGNFGIGEWWELQNAELAQVVATCFLPGTRVAPTQRRGLSLSDCCEKEIMLRRHPVCDCAKEEARNT
jgi:hypothetical protein